jgi:hypothetical protein
MSLSYALDHVSASTESVLVELAAKSELTLISTDTDVKTGAVVSTYTLASGDTQFPAYVTYRAEIQSRKTGVIRRISMTFDTWATQTDSVTGVIDRLPISASFAMNIPQGFTVELADIDDFIGVAFSFLFASQSSGARSTTYLSKLLYGAPQVV